MRAVIYARFSSAGQRDESIEGQVRECRAYASRKGIEVVGEYIDRAFSATTDKRPDFQRMIRDSSRRCFDCVICWKHDRFARNRYDAAIYKAKLKENGVSLLYAMEELPDGPQGVIIDSVMEGFAEYYSANLSENVLRGLYESALKRQTMGVRLLGLTEGPDKKFVHDENAPVVRRIFEEYASGKPAKLIIDDLNAEGFRTLRGQKFTKNSVRHIIENPKYYGLYQYRDISDLCIPPIVSKELWDRCQEVAALHHEAPAHSDLDGGYILTGKLFCGLCGDKMVAASGTSKSGKAHQYYSCRNAKKRECELRPVRKQEIEDRVCFALRDLIFNDEFVSSVADYYIQWQNTNEAAEGLRLLESRLVKVENEARRFVDAIAEKGHSSYILQRLDELEEEADQLRFSIDKYKAEHPVFTREQILAYLLDFRNGNVESTSWRVFLIHAFLEKAFVFPDGRVLLHLNGSGYDSPVTLSGIRQVSDVFSGGASGPATPRKFEHVEVVFLAGIFALLK